ncbi:MAG TPA: FtsQ-type POTRA domain-containing protein [Candidatus Butyricicoccus avistercoris]|uniref:FtsQ-type POTRA domain-containing protein n=1 Tax=Candidatus Butyricicoccus avistercoris TaxID=2838518 RepID=A0A9D1PHU1_9FIRM|nr:FtsQ-type POTRA domain-containing protein [Candidatus Butyricicoccus avistercoris]
MGNQNSTPIKQNLPNKPPSGNRKRPNKPISRSERQRRKVKQSVRRKISARIAFLIMTFIAAFLAVTIFFKIDSIEITATEHYTEDELISASGIEIGDNLFTFRTSKVEKELLEKYPYLASVSVTRSLPSTLVIKAVDSVPAAAVNLASGGYCLIDENGKLLEQASTVPEGIPTVTGVTVSDMAEGKYLTDNSKSEILVDITKVLKEKNIISNVNFINVSCITDVRMGYLGRLDVRLGQADKLKEKIQMLIHIAENELSPSDINTVYLEDATTVYCPPTTLEKIQQSALPISDVNPSLNA